MEKKDVPQDVGLAGEMREITYAVGEDGAYEKVTSYGWRAKTVALEQAWEVILRDLDRIEIRVRKGELSPLAWHMTRHQMNPGLLAKYVGLSRLRVRRHLKPRPFERLKPALLARYADLFGITVEDLKALPTNAGLEFPIPREPA
jgi:hypothetical protein